MAKKNKKTEAEKILESIRNENQITYDAFLSLYQYFVVNSQNLASFDILGGSQVEITEEGLEEKQLAVAEKRANMMAKFAEKYSYYHETLQTLRGKLDTELRERTSQEMEDIRAAAGSVEGFIFKEDK